MRELHLQGESHGWQCWTMPLGRLPLPIADRPALAEFLSHLLQTAVGVLNLTASVWLEATHLFLDNGNRLLAPNARLWAPRQGFGVQPTGELPRLWTKEDFAEAPWDHKPPVFNNQVWEISRPAGHTSAIEALAGRGVLSLLLLDGNAETFKREATTALQLLVTERVYRMYPYFFPLLEASALGSPHLSEWLGNARVYIREIFADGTLLLLSAVPLETALVRMGAERVHSGLYRFPLKAQPQP